MSLFDMLLHFSPFSSTLPCFYVPFIINVWFFLALCVCKVSGIPSVANKSALISTCWAVISNTYTFSCQIRLIRAQRGAASLNPGPKNPPPVWCLDCKDWRFSDIEKTRRFGSFFVLKPKCAESVPGGFELQSAQAAAVYQLHVKRGSSGVTGPKASWQRTSLCGNSCLWSFWYWSSGKLTVFFLKNKARGSSG